MSCYSMKFSVKFYSELTVFHIPNYLGDSKGNSGVTY